VLLEISQFYWFIIYLERVQLIFRVKYFLRLQYSILGRKAHRWKELNRHYFQSRFILSVNISTKHVLLFPDKAIDIFQNIEKKILSTISDRFHRALLLDYEWCEECVGFVNMSQSYEFASYFIVKNVYFFN